MAQRIAAMPNEIQTCAFQARVSLRVGIDCMAFWRGSNMAPMLGKSRSGINR
jgi:hypothetical protein